MSRTLSAAALSAALAQETSEVFLALLEIAHDDLGSPIRAVNNMEDVTSNGDVYAAFPFEVAMPAESGDAPSKAVLRIDNVDQSVITAIRSITTPPTATLSVILASSPDTIEAGPFEFTMREVDYDAQFVRAELHFEDILNEPFPADKYTPNNFPGLY